MATETRRRFAVITGASSGIGLELARQCVAHDFDVLICAKDPVGLPPAEQHLSATGSQVHTVAADLSTIEGCETLVSAIEGVGRPFDALLLNAGGVGGAFMDTELADEMEMIGLM